VAASSNAVRRVKWLARSPVGSGSIIGSIGAHDPCRARDYTRAVDSEYGVVELLRTLSACPTAPFHEQYVARRIAGLCRGLGLTVEPDRYGNALVWYRGAAADTAPLALNAHMDHPALEVVADSPLTGRLLGGARSTRGYFARPVRVRFVVGETEIPGRIVGLTDDPNQSTVMLAAERAVPVGSFGVFDVGPAREGDGLLHVPAADDLAGCVSIVATLARCVAERIPANVLAVFTRAEEVGLIGATLVARQGLIPRDSTVVSLEASRELPGAAIGAGPVIRVGDRQMAFHPAGEALLLRAASLVRERREGALIQRQLMSGGTCEATAYAVAGYVTTGVAIPLGNYHNAGPDMTIAAEYVSPQDLITAVDVLCAAAEASAHPAPADPLAERLNRVANEAADRLAVSARTLLVD